MGEMNRLANCHNRFQGSAKRVLCICSAGLLRSPTAANVLHKTFGYNTRAAGVSTDFALVPLDAVLLAWADEVVVMESWMAHHFPPEYSTPIVCLNIEDSYEYMDEQLQTEILAKYKEKTNG